MLPCDAPSVRRTSEDSMQTQRQRCRRRWRFATLRPMPPTEPVGPEKSLEQVVEEVGLYPLAAYEFVQHGHGLTVKRVHGEIKDKNTCRHIGGRDLCEGLRELALKRWGRMARAVLARWNIRRTVDFGNIVFALVEG